MPKDNINSDVMEDGARVEVGWQPGLGMHVMTTNSKKTVTPELRFEGDTESRTTSPLSQEPFVGWCVNLDREGANRLIRSLRKARDSAFGRDE